MNTEMIQEYFVLSVKKDVGIHFCQLRHVLIYECDKSFDENLWKHINNNKHSARQWIKEYERMVSFGELDFIEKYKH